METARIKSCSFFPYSIDENSEISILFRCKKSESKQSGMYQEFGTTLKENEPNILFSAARSYVVKCASLFLHSELQHLSVRFEIRRVAKEFLSKSLDLYTNAKVKEVLKELIENKFTVHTEVLAQNHLAIFYPLAFFRTEPINSVFQDEFDGTRYQDISFHWIPLSQIIKPAFYERYLSSFNFQVISYMAERVVIGLQTSQITESLANVTKKCLPMFAILNGEPEPHWQVI